MTYDPLCNTQKCVMTMHPCRPHGCPLHWAKHIVHIRNHSLDANLSADLESLHCFTRSAHLHPLLRWPGKKKHPQTRTAWGSGCSKKELAQGLHAQDLQDSLVEGTLILFNVLHPCSLSQASETLCKPLDTLIISIMLHHARPPFPTEGLRRSAPSERTESRPPAWPNCGVWWL